VVPVMRGAARLPSFSRVYVPLLRDVEAETQRIRPSLVAPWKSSVFTTSAGAQIWPADSSIPAVAWSYDATMYLLERVRSPASIDGWIWDAPSATPPRKYAETGDASLNLEGHKAGRHYRLLPYRKLHNLELLPSTVSPCRAQKKSR